MRAVEEHAASFSVKEFVVGERGAFDRVAARAVTEVRAAYPEIRLTLLLPFHPGQRPAALPEGFDGSRYRFGPEYIPPRAAVIRANRAAVRAAERLIICASDPSGNTAVLLAYARRREGLAVTEIPFT